MAIKTEERSINGHKYSVTQFNAMEGLKIKIRLSKYIGPSLSHLVEGEIKNTEDILNANIDKQGAMVAVEKLIEQLDEEETIRFILRMFKSGIVRRDGVEINETVFNAEYAGNYIELYKALGFIIEVNYGKDFFGEGGIGNLIKEAIAKKSIPSTQK